MLPTCRALLGQPDSPLFVDWQTSFCIPAGEVFHILTCLYGRPKKMNKESRFFVFPIRLSPRIEGPLDRADGFIARSLTQLLSSNGD